MQEEIKGIGRKWNPLQLGIFLDEHKELLLQCVFAAFIFTIGTYRIKELGTPILHDDEYGYWAASAFFLGQDWSSVTSRIAYYSYGYGLLLVPLRLLGRILQWGYLELYQNALIVNVFLLIGSYFIACRICKRYMPHMNWIVRSAACFVTVIYSSNIVYAHITWTENSLYFFFWLFIYTLMRCTDKPSMKNHACLAVSAFYLYTIHQRAVAELIAAVMIILYMRLIKANTFRQTAAFWGSFYLCSLVHTMIKSKLQNDFYLAKPPAGIKETLMYAFSLKSLVILLIGIFIFFLLYLQEKGKRKLLCVTIGLGLAAVIGFLIYGGGIFAPQTTVSKIAINDFAGQWGKIRRIFSLAGVVRLSVSITGKWFYLVAATGLVACWGMKEFIKHVFWMAVDGVRRSVAWFRQKDYVRKEILLKCPEENIWKLGVILAWMGSFMVCAIYKEGFYKVDDLVNGRYNEFAAGILIIYGFYSLLEDRRWIRTLLVSLVLFVAAGALSQYAFNELQRTEFELAHAVMFGRVFWNWQVPVGKVKEYASYVIPMGVAFVVVLKLFTSRIQNVKIVTLRCILGLMIPALAWTYLSRSITDHYTVVIASRTIQSISPLADWIDYLDREKDKTIYYMDDQEAHFWAGQLQLMLPEHKFILMSSEEAPYGEEAFFLTDRAYGKGEDIQEKCATVTETHRFSLLVSRENELMRRMEAYKKTVN